MKIWHLAIAAIAVGGLGGGYWLYEQSRPCSKAVIYDAAQADVLAQLKAPSTAIFPPMSEVKLSYVDNPCVSTIHGWVDAQNSFGAMIRRKFTGFFILDREDGPDMRAHFDPE
jgi:hypothetical protein